jgi:4-carboxymuconolactone decarboxylase
MEPRLPLPADSDLSPEIREMLSNFPAFNALRMIANAPVMFSGFMQLSGSIAASDFDPRKREIAILRVAQMTASEYVWSHHVFSAILVGVTDDEIAEIGTLGTVTGLDEEGNLLCRVADEITRDVRLSDEALTQILARYGVRHTMELILCCGFYNMMSRILESTRVEPEAKDVKTLVEDFLASERMAVTG